MSHTQLAVSIIVCAVNIDLAVLVNPGVGVVSCGIPFTLLGVSITTAPYRILFFDNHIVFAHIGSDRQYIGGIFGQYSAGATATAITPHRTLGIQHIDAGACRNHSFCLLALQIHLYHGARNVNGIAGAQLTVVIVTPAPHRAVFLQNIIGIRLTSIAGNSFHAGKGFPIGEDAVGRLLHIKLGHRIVAVSTITIVLIHHTVLGEYQQVAATIIPVIGKLLDLFKALHLGGHGGIAAPPPKGAVGQQCHVAIAIALHLHHFHLRFHVRDADQDVGIQLGAVDGSPEGGIALFALHQNTVFIHIGNLGVGGLPYQARIGGIFGINDDAQVGLGGLILLAEQQQAFFDLHRLGGDDHFHRYGVANRAVGAVSRDGRRTLGQRGELAGLGDFQHVLVAALIIQQLLRGVGRGQQGDQLAHILHVHAEIFAQVNGLQRGAIHHVDGQLPPDLPVGRIDPDDGVALCITGHQTVLVHVGDGGIFRFIDQQCLCHVGGAHLCIDLPVGLAVDGHRIPIQLDGGHIFGGQLDDGVIIIIVTTVITKSRHTGLAEALDQLFLHFRAVHPDQLVGDRIAFQADGTVMHIVFAQELPLGLAVDAGQGAAQVFGKALHNAIPGCIRVLYQQIDLSGSRIGDRTLKGDRRQTGHGQRAGAAVAFPQIIVVAVEHARIVGIDRGVIRVSQLYHAVHKDATFVISLQHRIKIGVAVAIKCTVLSQFYIGVRRLAACMHLTAGKIAIIKAAVPVILGKFAVFGIGNIAVNEPVIIFRLEIDDVGVPHLHHAAALFINSDGIIAHQFTGEDLDGLFLGALQQQGAAHIQISDAFAGIGILGIIGPELDLGARLHSHGYALGDLQGAGNDVIIVSLQRHILVDPAGEDHAAPHLHLQRGRGRVAGLVPVVQTVFSLHPDIQLDDVIVGAVLVDLQQEGLFPTDEHIAVHLLAAVAVGISANAAVIDGGRHLILVLLALIIGDGHKGAGNICRRQGIHRHQRIFCHTPAVPDGEAQRHSFAGINDAVAVVVGIQLHIVKDAVIGDAHIGSGNGGDRIVDVGDGRQVVLAMGVGVKAGGSFLTRVDDLTVNKLGRIGAALGIGIAQHGRHSGNDGSRHGSAVPGGVFVAGDGAHDVLTGSIDLVFLGGIEGHIVVGKGRFHAVFIHAHDAQDIFQGSGIVGQSDRSIFIGHAIVTGRCYQHAVGIGLFQCVGDGDGAGRAAKGHIDDICAVFIGVNNGLGNVRLVEIAAGLASFDGHDLGAVSNAHHADVVVYTGNDTGHVGTVTVIVHGITDKGILVAVVGDSVKAVIVVNVVISIIVDSIVGDFFLVNPDIILQILVVIVHAGINHCHNDALAVVGGEGFIAFPDLVDTMMAQMPLLMGVFIAAHGFSDRFTVRHTFHGIGKIVFRHQHVVNGTDSGHNLFHFTSHIGLVPDGIGQSIHLFQMGHTGVEQLSGQLAGGFVFQLDQNSITAVRKRTAGKQIGINLIKRLGQRIVFIHIAGLRGHVTLLLVDDFLVVLPFCIITDDNAVIIVCRFLIIVLQQAGLTAQRHQLTQFGQRHTGDNSRHLTTLNGAVRQEGSLLVAAGQNTCTIQRIDRLVIGHIGDRTIRHLIDGGQVFCRQSLCQDLRKLQASSCLGIVGRLNCQHAVLLRIVHIHLIPGASLHKVFCAGRCQRMNSCRYRYGFRQSHLSGRTEGAAGVTAHQAQLIGLLDRLLIPLAAFHIVKLTSSIGLYRLKHFHCSSSRNSRQHHSCRKQDRKKPLSLFHRVHLLYLYDLHNIYEFSYQYKAFFFEKQYAGSIVSAVYVFMHYDFSLKYKKTASIRLRSV